MDNQLQKENKKIFTLSIKQNIEGDEWQKLVDALPVDEEIGILHRVSLRYGRFHPQLLCEM